MGETLRIEVVAEEELTGAFHSARLSSQTSSLAQASRCLSLENTMHLLFWPLSPFLLLGIALGNGFVELFSEHLSGGHLRGTGKLLRSRSGEP